MTASRIHPLPPQRTALAQQRALIDAAFALGVPVDHGRMRGLRQIREPNEFAFIGYDTQNRPQWLAPRAARAWMRMHDAAMRANVELQVVSAFRSVEYQLSILKRKIERDQPIESILGVSAAPGYSEHHSGRALDLTTPGFTALEEEFEKSGAFAWLSTNAQSFGFGMSYPRDNRHGIAYEPWHWCWRERTIKP